MSKEFALNIAEKLLTEAQKMGAQQTEVIVMKGKQYSIRIEESNIVRANNTTITGAGFRVLSDNRIGLGSSSQLDEKVLLLALNDAITLAKISDPDPNLIGFASKPKKYPMVKGLFDKPLSNLQSEELVELTIQMLNAALEKDSSVNVSGNLNLTIGAKAIANSNGIAIADDNTFMNVFISSKIDKNDDIGVGYEFGFGRSLKDIDLEKIGTSATDKAFNLLGGQKIASGDYPILFDERSTRQTIGGILSDGISAYNIIQGTAFFNDRLGEEIASTKLTVYDNPLEIGGTNSRRFDDEGTPCQKITVVDKGTLLAYLSDVYTSHKLSIPNTGSASKPSYDGLPHPALRLIQVEPGDASKEELFAELGTGLYLENGLGSIYGTNISQQVDQGFWVENGEIKFPVKNTMLGTTVYDVLKNIRLLGKEVFVESGMKSPMMLIDKVKVSSGR